MLSKIVLLTGTTCLCIGFVLRRKEDVFKRLFKELRNCPKYHTDYLEELDHLPLDKHMILFGPAKKMGESPFISPNFIQKSPAEDRLWSFKFTEPFKLLNASN